jgi:hypothetical protein
MALWKGGGSSGAVYNVVTNYDAPGRPPAYWTAQRRDRLSEEARARCLAYCPPSR